MKFTFGWLKEHLNTKATLEEVVEKLTMIGLEVDQVHDRAKDLDGFVAARVVEARKHPDADKLTVCQVDNGSETLEVVCGAPNARTGLIGVFAESGSYIPGTGITLKPTEIRGVVSNGMLLSEKEVNLGDDHDGIIELPDDTALGSPAADALGLADPVIEIEITPNRGDCLGVRGITRDLAAAGVGTLKPLDRDPVPGTFESPIKVHLDFDKGTEDACPYFVGRFIRGVKNGESPKWLKDKLTAIGLRPISALVDITNLMTIDLGRPLHVFDAAKVEGDIHVRLSKKGEKILALDGKEYELGGGMTVIADDEKAEALGGVIGGEESGCTEGTVDIFVESAFFDPVRTAMTGRKLNILSDARYRFERGVDPAFLVDGMEITTRLVMDLCGGEPSELVIAGSEPKSQQSITLRPERIENFGGVKVAKKKITDILSGLGFEAKRSKNGLNVSVPSWRSDIVGEACLVEEVVRIFGYDNIPAIPMDNNGSLPHPALSPGQRRRAMARRLLAGRGLVEAVTYSFLGGAEAALFGGGGESLKLINPISADLAVMRPSLLPNLIAAAARNAARGTAEARLFEIGPSYSGVKPDEQAMKAAGIRSGSSGARNWAEKPRPVDVFDAKGDVLAVLGGLGVAVEKAEIAAEAPDWYHPGHSGVVRLGPKSVLAHFGEIHPRVLKDMNAESPMAGFEIIFDNLPKLKERKSRTRPHLELPQFHSVERDFAFVVDRVVTAAQVINAAEKADKKLIAQVSLFDVFEGGDLGEGKKSLAVNVVLQPVEKTLTDAEIDAIAEKVVANVTKATGGVLRG
ncbi:MAG: phenylalanine--tRNA ligase subunit beta [Rhodospirillaceae bacterium]|jgi:phenylalanyl-tRNA synthetase beta chain|nr:phenylalanine--tRNA ligase subunit beta [Rhodospirillaceae bacterium]|tara:strand:+ start:1769 stop:4174 length:2406 start_codon:yes stop_codon:yes gene_type:complete